MHRKLIEQDIGLVVSIDHALLVQGKGFNSEQERQILNDLCRSLINLKTKFAQQKGKIIIILLSQLNRDIESPERITNANLHYPTKSDIFGSDAIYQASDYVVVIHRPATMEGIGDYYGPKQAGFPKGLPLVSPYDEKRQMVYWHLIKNRFGMAKIFPMVEDYAHSKINEINLKP